MTETERAMTHAAELKRALWVSWANGTAIVYSEIQLRLPTRPTEAYDLRWEHWYADEAPDDAAWYRVTDGPKSETADPVTCEWVHDWDDGPESFAELL